MEEKILLFIPMYNCEKQIVRVINQLQGEIANYISEAIVVNNRSTDNGEQAAQEAIERLNPSFPIRILRNRENYGLGGSHKVAFHYAIDNGFDYVIVLHGDDQGRLNDLLPALREGDYQKFDCYLGGRFLRSSVLQGYSRFRTFGNRVFNVVFSIAIGRKVYDLGAGLNLYKVKMLKSNFFEKYPDNLTFNCYMLFALSAYRQSHQFFKILWREEDQVSNVKMTRQAIQTLKMALGYFFSRKRFLEKDARVKRFLSYDSDVIFDYEANL